MKLTLTLAPSSRGKPGDTASAAVFDETGGTIGRATDNLLILRHNKVSAKHARVTFRSGTFYIQDTSRNGTAVNSPSNRLVQDRPYALEDGDRVLVEPYEIEVRIDNDAGRRRDDDHVTGLRGGAVAGSLDLESPSEVLAGGEVNPMALLPLAKPSKAVARPQRPVLPPGDLLTDPYQPPDVAPEVPAPPVEAIEIPPDWDPFAPESGIPSEAAPRPRPSAGHRTVPPPLAPQPDARSPEPVVNPQRRMDPGAPEMPGPSPAQTADLSALLRGAGLPDAAVTPELMRDMGEILRVVVAGLIDVLRSRQQIKAEFRLEQTIVRPVRNNPLKSSADAKDALHNLFVKRNAAYLAPVAAFADAFDDVCDHQFAMLAGMKVAFEAMLAEFDPDQLQASFDRELAKMTLPLVPAKLRYWELYRQRRADMMRDPDTAFQRLFGEAFGEAYEEQSRRLKAQREKSRRRDAPTPESAQVD